jgi:hypothetical protein
MHISPRQPMLGFCEQEPDSYFAALVQATALKQGSEAGDISKQKEAAILRHVVLRPLWGWSVWRATWLTKGKRRVGARWTLPGGHE